jgi:hypothetical protein
MDGRLDDVVKATHMQGGHIYSLGFERSEREATYRSKLTMLISFNLNAFYARKDKREGRSSQGEG